MMGMDAVTEFAGLLEVALDHVRKGRATVTSERLAVIRESVELLHGLLAGGTGVTVRDADRALIARMVPPELTHIDDDSNGAVPIGLAAGLVEHPPVKIELNKLDALLLVTREISAARTQLMREMGPGLDLAAGATFALTEMDRLLDDLQQQVTRLRLVPLCSSFRHHVRTVSDMATVASKLARLEFEGEEMEVDAAVVDHLRDAVTHLLSNAVDPGLEYPAVRMAAAKDPCGTIRLRVRQEGGEIVIEVSDDGNGREIAPDDKEMNAVRRDVEVLRGSLEVTSEAGVGTTVTLRVPRTLALPAEILEPAQLPAHSASVAA